MRFRLAAALVGALSALGVSAAKLLSLVPYQENGLWVAFALPAWLGLLAGAWRGPSLTAPEESST